MMCNYGQQHVGALACKSLYLVVQRNSETLALLRVSAYVCPRSGTSERSFQGHEHHSFGMADLHSKVCKGSKYEGNMLTGLIELHRRVHYPLKQEIVCVCSGIGQRNLLADILKDQAGEQTPQ